MSERRTAAYGTWASPISAAAAAGASIGLSEVSCVGESVYWLESRPQEGGRSVIVRRVPGREAADLTPPGYDARTRVHEYGGGSYLAAHDVVFFSNFADGRVYRQPVGAEPRPITPETLAPSSTRYADFALSPDGRRLYAVRESHSVSGDVVNDLVALSADGSVSPAVVASGHDFYSSPRVSPDGRRLAWLCWDHPNMPWDESELWLGELSEDGALTAAERIAGGDGVSVFQPEWGAPTDGESALYFVSDEGGWWRPIRYGRCGFERLSAEEAEFGQPQWVFGLKRYALLQDGTLACIVTRQGSDSLLLRHANGEVVQPPLAFNVLRSIASDGRRVYFVGASPTAAAAVIAYEPSDGTVEVVRRSSTVEFDEGYLSAARAISFPTAGEQQAHAFSYAPANRDFLAPEGELPPLLVFVHGGPTSATSPALEPRIQFWTSRGFAVVDVNYRGSSGYGRAYRDALRGRWGVADIEDAVAAARYLVEQGRADPRRLAIRGGSAGGYTTLAALAFTDVFSAGASHFGVSDLERLALDTHKFESRYLDGMIGPYPAEAETYRRRSPLYAATQIDAPLILFQGLEDRVVPPSQAEMMVEALDERRVPHAYVTYEGEGHGFRKADNIRRTLESELSFYGQIWGFTPADALPPLQIAHLGRHR